MRRLRLVLVILLVILLLAVGGFIVWASTPPAPLPQAIDAINDGNDTIYADTNRWLAFSPEGEPPTTGFIFYPGGRVTAESYAPALRDIALAGYLVVAVPMPLNLAFFSPNSADAVIAAYPDVEHWVIGGHSLGGAMAGRYAHDHADRIDGIVLWASFVEDSYSLADREIAAASIYGTLDGLATPDDIAASRAALPADTQFVAIEGGNHAQFGWYGDQQGDNAATISREEQQAQVVTATVAVLAEVKAEE
jgi:pimeloyl-ACP methyl ester carboxylesterase